MGQFSVQFMRLSGSVFDANQQTDKKILCISPEIQDKQIRKQSDELLLGAFENLRNEIRSVSGKTTKEIDQLKNLVHGIGYLFQAFLMDEKASQRRIFSFYLSDDPPDHLRDTLNLGIRCGYFYKDAIGRKEGMGRTTLYVLTRRLAPAFKLDPVGFSNYLSVTSSFLCGLMENPRTYTNRLRTQQEDVQLQLGLTNQESQ